jgi:hypothetical protein
LKPLKQRGDRSGIHAEADTESADREWRPVKQLQDGEILGKGKPQRL